jgi:glycosyltransferase involved in cell wall biosynthesis
MIPTYNARSDYLEETLRGILAQAPDPQQMQIEVLDDCSPDGGPMEAVQKIAGDRVKVHREPKNLGLAKIWNRCIERAQGEWVHILHQDDVVMPGFYEALRKGIESDPGVGAAFVRHVTIDPDGHWRVISDVERETAGRLENWHERITVHQQIQCAAIVVHRSVYEKLGGFLPQLCFTLDWEMWQRIAAHYPFWFEPSILAGYRQHPASATSRLRLAAADIRDVRDMIEITASYHSGEQGRKLVRQAREVSAINAIANSRHLFMTGHYKVGRRQIAEALRLSHSWLVICELISLLNFWMRITGAKIKRQLRR